MLHSEPQRLLGQPGQVAGRGRDPRRHPDLRLVARHRALALHRHAPDPERIGVGRLRRLLGYAGEDHPGARLGRRGTGFRIARERPHLQRSAEQRVHRRERRERPAERRAGGAAREESAVVAQLVPAGLAERLIQCGVRVRHRRARRPGIAL